MQKNAFTLIELLLAVFILSLGLLGIIQAFILGTQISKINKMSTISSELIQEKLEEEISRGYDALTVGTTTENYGSIADYSAFKRIKKTVCVRSSDLAEADCNYDLVNNPDPLKKISVTVSWQFPFEILSKEIKAETYISKK